MGDGFHIFFIFFISPDLDPYGMSSFKINYYNILDRSTYIDLFKYGREGGESVVQSDEGIVRGWSCLWCGRAVCMVAWWAFGSFVGHCHRRQSCR